MGARKTIAQKLRDNTVEHPSGCLVWSGWTDKDGYGQMQHRVDGTVLRIRPHRAAYEAVHGPIPAGMYVCHRCDNPSCCNPSHLFLGTPGDNVIDMIKKGRRPMRNMKLTPQQASAIRSSTEVDKVLSKKYGVARGVIWQIRTGKTWRSA